MIRLLACAPFTNQPFLDEAVFLGALPGDSRLAGPRDVVLAPNGSSAVLRVAKENATRWDGWWQLAMATGDELRQVAPDERTDVVRAWSAVNVASRIDGGPLGLPPGVIYDWWVEAAITKPVDGDIGWRIAVAPTREGPFVDVGEGAHGEGEGSLTWDLALTAETLGLAPSEVLGTLEATYVDRDPEYDDLRTAVATYAVPGELDSVFGLIGDNVFGFTAPLAITGDGASWPAYTTAAHTEDGGRAEGVVGTLDGQLTFVACWDGDGGVQYQGGDAGITGLGSASGCALPSFDR